MVVVPGEAIVLPDNVRAPLHPPEATHDAVLVELHVSVDVAPMRIEEGAATNVSVGIGSGLTVTVVVA